MVSEPCRWGVAGFGWVARDYMLPGLRAAGGRLAAVHDPSEAARAAGEDEGAVSFADLEAFARSGIDAAYVASPNVAHPEAVEVLARAGVPILCEKPMAADVAGAEAMAAAVRRAGVLYGTAFDQRHHPGHEALRAAIRDGAAGRVACVRIAYCCWVDPTWSTGTGDNWRADAAAAGGGAVVDLAPHGLDLCQYLLGEEVHGLHMALQNRVHDYPVEDGGVVCGRTASGVLVTMHTAYNTPEALPRRRLEVVGSEAMLTATDTMGQTPGGSLTRTDGQTGAAAPLPFDADTSPFTRQAAAFQRAARGEAHDFDLTRDLDLTRRFFAAYEEASCR